MCYGASQQYQGWVVDLDRMSERSRLIGRVWAVDLYRRMETVWVT